jgi:hypothetical protein
LSTSHRCSGANDANLVSHHPTKAGVVASGGMSTLIAARKPWTRRRDVGVVNGVCFDLVRRIGTPQPVVSEGGQDKHTAAVRLS